MTRDKEFVINSIKMDLFRIVTATGDLTKKIPQKSVIAFLNHADKDFDKIELTQREKEIREKLRILADKLPELRDPEDRLRWTEDVMTARCRL